MAFAFSDEDLEAMEASADHFVPIGDALANALTRMFEDWAGKGLDGRPIRDAAAAALDYLSYLKTEHWRAIRDRALLRAGRACQRCGSRRALQVHHLTYNRIGREAEGDLMVLCRRCHAAEHGIADA